MNISWWFDVIIFIVLAFLVYVGFRLHRYDEGGKGFAPEKESYDLRSKGFRLYPRKLIRQAGILPNDVRGLYWSSKTLMALLLPAIIIEWRGSSPSVFGLLLLAVLGFVSVDLFLLNRRRARRQKIERSLSFFIDLIVAFLHSGQSLAQAFKHAAQYGLPKRSPLCQEVELVARELEVGRDRNTAFTGLAERTGVKDLARLAAIMHVGFRVGSPIGETLEAQSDLLRTKQWERGAELVNRKVMESLLPMVLVSLPIFIVLVFFPVGVQLYEALTMFVSAF